MQDRRAPRAARFITLALPLLMGWAAIAVAPPAAAESQEQQPTTIHQLRIYEIFPHNKQAFHARFRDHAARIMAKYDFKILAMWETQSAGRTEFVYLLQWPDRQMMTDRWAKFMADPEWAEIKRRTAAQHGQLVGEIQERVLEITDYSPALPRSKS